VEMLIHDRPARRGTDAPSIDRPCRHGTLPEPFGPENPLRILLVEDEERFAAAIRRGLEAEGFIVDVVHDGIAGMRMATENAYDAIVLDILLPGENGYSVCSRLREAGNWTPILMLTALDDELDEAEGLDCGADDYITKPFSYAVLLARLRALIRRGATERPAVLEIGDLRLDPAAHRCWRAGTEVTLTTKEFALLEYLMRHPGEVLAKTELLEHVWDFAFADSSNVVEVYVGYLRKKLDRSDNATIETVRGAGYRLPAGD
jgi:two-component system OmpR family response regulator